MSYEHKREHLKEEEYVDKTREDKDKPSGILGKIQQVAKGGLEKVEQIYEDIIGGGPSHPKAEQHVEHHVRVEVPLEPREEEALRESELYRRVLKENEEGLIQSAEKVEKSRTDMCDELEKVRSFARQADETFRSGAAQLQQVEAQMRQEADLVGGILRDNEQILLDVSQKLDSSSKRLRQEVNRIKAEELKRASDELKLRAERLEQYAEETTKVAETFEERGSDIKGHEQTKEGQYPSGHRAETHKGAKHEVRHPSHYYQEGYPGQVPPKEHETHETFQTSQTGQQSSTEQLATQPRQHYEQEKVEQKSKMF